MVESRSLGGVCFGVGMALSLFSPLTWSASFDDEFEEKPWVETEARFPAFPEQENLIPFQVGSVSDKQFLIDEKSISVGDDGVIRYTLVVVTDSGARSVSYEGMRCATRERRFYGFGQSDKTWSKARNGKWARIQGSSNQYPVALYSDYFCTADGGGIYRAGDAVRKLRYGR